MATRRGVVYELDANEQKAIDGFRRAIGKAKQMEAAVSKGSAKMTRGHARHGQELKGLAAAYGDLGHLGGMVMQGLAMSAIMGAGTAVMVGAVRELQGQAKIQEDFEREITGLLSLGSNVENIKLIKREVVDLSNAFNRPREEIAEFLFNLQSNAANLSEEIRGGIKKESLELAQVTGATLPTSVNVLTKAWQAYGDELRGVNDLQNKIYLTAERGAITLEKLGTFAPDVFQSAAALGYSIDETLGAFITATQKGGRTEKVLTGVRNVFVRMDKAAEKLAKKKFEFSLTGSLVEDLRQLEAVPGNVLAEVFGEEAIASIAALTSGVEDLAAEIERLRTVEGDLAADREKQRLKDPAYVRSETITTARRGSENLMLEGGKTAFAQRLTEEFVLAERGIRGMLPAPAQFLAKPAAVVDMVGERVLEGINWAFIGGEYRGDRLSPAQAAGAMAVIGDYRKTGRDDLADAFKESLPPGDDFSFKKLGAALQRNKREKADAARAAHETMPEVSAGMLRLGAFMEATDASPPGQWLAAMNSKIEDMVDPPEKRAHRREMRRLRELDRERWAQEAEERGPSFLAKALKVYATISEAGPRTALHGSILKSDIFGIPDPATGGEDFGRLAGMDRQGGGAGVGRDEERRILSELLAELRSMRGGDRGEDGGMQSAIERQTEAAKELAAAMENKGPRGGRGHEMTPRADASSAFAEVSEAG